MAINFPSSPGDGEEYTDVNSGTWVYDSGTNSWTLTAAGSASAFNFRGGHDFTQATPPAAPIESGDMWVHDGPAGTVNGVYNGLTGTIPEGQLVLWDGSKYVAIASAPGYPNLDDGKGSTLDDRYVNAIGDNMTGDLTLGTDKITLDATDGGADFASLVKADTRASLTPISTFYGLNTSTELDDATLKLLNGSANGYLVSGLGNNASNVFHIKNNGSAKFNNVITNNDPAGGLLTGSKIAQGFIATRPTNSNHLWTGFKTTNPTPTSYIQADGNASFASTRSTNFLIETERDNDDNYTVTTDVDEEGNTVETRVYNGPTLDVKDRLQNLLARVDAMEANEVIDDATDSSLLTLVSNLDTRLNGIEARIAALEAA